MKKQVIGFLAFLAASTSLIAHAKGVGIWYEWNPIALDLTIYYGIDTVDPSPVVLSNLQFALSGANLSNGFNNPFLFDATSITGEPPSTASKALIDLSDSLDYAKRTVKLTSPSLIYLGIIDMGIPPIWKPDNQLKPSIALGAFTNNPTKYGWAIDLTLDNCLSDIIACNTNDLQCSLDSATPEVSQLENTIAFLKGILSNRTGQRDTALGQRDIALGQRDDLQCALDSAGPEAAQLENTITFLKGVLLTRTGQRDEQIAINDSLVAANAQLTEDLADCNANLNCGLNYEKTIKESLETKVKFLQKILAKRSQERDECKEDLDFCTTHNGGVMLSGFRSASTIVNNLTTTLGMTFELVEKNLFEDLIPVNNNKFALKVGVQNTGTTAKEHRSSNYLVGSLAFNQMRLGLVIDKALYNELPDDTKLSNKNPLVGFFLGYGKDKEGFSTKISYNYMRNIVSQKRNSDNGSEPGFGRAPLTTKGFILQVSYGQRFKEKNLLQPYLGLHNIKLTRESYQEETSSLVTQPLTYSKVETERTGLIIGTKGQTSIKPNVFLSGNLALETKLAIKALDIKVTGLPIPPLVQKMPANKDLRFIGGLSLSSKQGPGLASINYLYQGNNDGPGGSNTISLEYKIDL